MTVNSVSWNKVITVCSVFGIPFISVAAWLIIGGTQLVGTVNTLVVAQNKLSDKVDQMSIKLDTVWQRQIDNKKDMDMKFQFGNFTQHRDRLGNIFYEAYK